jgi:hypothetical protein
MKIVRKKEKVKTHPLADIAIGDEVFVFVDDQDEAPCIRVFGFTYMSRKSKSKKKVEKWLEDNGLFPVVCLCNGEIYACSGNEEVVLLKDAVLYY